MFGGRFFTIYISPFLPYNNFMKKFISVFLFFVLLNFSFAEEIFVCVGSFKNPENAENLVKNLENLGTESFVFETQVNNQTLYRVLLSNSFDLKEEARKFRNSVENADFAQKLNLSGFWICQANKPVFDKTTKGPAADSVAEAVKPIILEENKNEIPVSEEKPYSVFVHSYKEEQAAENGKKRLQENEIDSFILKTFDEKSYFSFDLHSGAFDSPEEAEPLQEKLEALGIEDTKIADYKEEKEKIQKYDEIIKNQPVSYDFGNNEIPDIYSVPVATIIRQFPINKNFTLENLMIFDFDNLRSAEEKLPSLEDVSDIVGGGDNLHAVSIASYKDDLFNKNVKIFIFSGDKDSLPDILELKKEFQEDVASKEDSDEDSDFKVRDMQFQLKDGILNSLIFNSDEDYIFFGVNEKRDLAVLMATEDFSESQFEDFLNNFENDSSLLIYPQIRRTLLVLPKKTETERKFLSFTLEKVDESYAESKGYADWAIPIVGHWSADANFCQEDEFVSVTFFDLDYDYNAKQNHQMFMDEHIVTETSHASTVKNADSWFVEPFGRGKEVSFSTKSYIIAVNSFDLDEEELVQLSDELQIWEK